MDLATPSQGFVPYLLLLDSSSTELRLSLGTGGLLLCVNSRREPTTGDVCLGSLVQIHDLIEMLLI